MAWWLVDSIMNGTLDEDYPIKLKDDCYPTLGSTMSPAQDDIDGIYAYHYPPLSNDIIHSDYYYDYTRNGLTKNPFKKDVTLNSEVNQSESMAHYYKYHEEEILKDVEEYVSGTYRGHYTGDTHEYRNVQTIDLMAARSLASAFCQSNILKYGSRYGSKDGKEKKDLLKVIHYAMLLLHFDEHYGKPKITTGNIDHTMP